MAEGSWSGIPPEGKAKDMLKTEQELNMLHPKKLHLL